jgi:hypothetical protein
MTDELKQFAAAVAAEVARALQPEKVEQIVTLPDAARLLKMQPCSLRKLVYTNGIGYIIDGKVYKFKVSDLNAYLNAHYTPARG